MSDVLPATPDADALLAERIYPFDARGIATRLRHPAIFGALDALCLGETVRLIADHDPLPLLRQIGARYGDRIGIAYHARDPQRVVIDFIRRRLGGRRVTPQPIGAVAPS